MNQERITSLSAAEIERRVQKGVDLILTVRKTRDTPWYRIPETRRKALEVLRGDPKIGMKQFAAVIGLTESAVINGVGRYTGLLFSKGGSIVLLGILERLTQLEGE